MVKKKIGFLSIAFAMSFAAVTSLSSFTDAGETDTKKKEHKCVWTSENPQTATVSCEGVGEMCNKALDCAKT